MGHDDAAPLLDRRYRLEQEIGRGGMSVVYRATDEVLHRPVAVKLFHPGSVDLARQEAELGVLAALEHHGLVGLLDAGVVDVVGSGPRRFLVMSLVVGQDLEARLEVGPLSAKHIAEIGYDMAEALEYIHPHGVVHRDIKPSNILLVDYGTGSDRARARLTDFGIALAAGVERLTADGVTTGTAAYLSPEQARGADVGPASDVYSLGLVLLQCFTRRREFPGSLVESAIARLSRDPVVPEPLPEHWKHLLRAMTAQDPADRPLGAQLVAMLRDVVITESAAGDPATPDARTDAAATAAPAAAAATAAPADAAAAGAAAAHVAPADAAAAGARPATFDSLPEESLQRTVAMAARLFDAPIALVDVLDEDREWSQSWIAEGVDEAARNISFRSGFAPVPVPVVIPDGSQHPEMRQSPLVTGPLGIRFYVSVPCSGTTAPRWAPSPCSTSGRARRPRPTWRTSATSRHWPSRSSNCARRGCAPRATPSRSTARTDARQAPGRPSAHATARSACSAVIRVTAPQFVHSLRCERDNGTSGTKNRLSFVVRRTTRCAARTPQTKRTTVSRVSVPRVPKIRNTPRGYAGGADDRQPSETVTRKGPPRAAAARAPRCRRSRVAPRPAPWSTAVVPLPPARPTRRPAAEPRGPARAWGSGTSASPRAGRRAAARRAR